MKLIKFKINDFFQSESYLYQLESFDESGKMNLRYAIWSKDNIWFFGLADESEKPILGMELIPNKERILKHIKYIIENKEIMVHYVYFPPPPERIGIGIGIEMVSIPSLVVTKLQFPNSVIQNLKKIQKTIRGIE
jgi:hypothetical protein